MPKLLIVNFIALVLSSLVALPAIANEPTSKKKAPITKADFMKQAYDRFSKMDSNHDGFLSKTELTAKRAKKRKASSTKRFNKLDTDNNGYMSQEEYLQFVESQTEKARETYEQKSKDWFETADEDRNGYLSKDEFLTYRMKKRSSFSTYNLESKLNYYKRLDIDEDGTVSRNEYVNKIGRFGKSEKSKKPFAMQLPDGKGGTREMVRQDGNGDKKVARSENEKFQTFVFEMCDKDNDQELSSKESKQCIGYARWDKTR